MNKIIKMGLFAMTAVALCGNKPDSSASISEFAYTLPLKDIATASYRPENAGPNGTLIGNDYTVIVTSANDTLALVSLDAYETCHNRKLDTAGIDHGEALVIPGIKKTDPFAFISRKQEEVFIKFSDKEYYLNSPSKIDFVPEGKVVGRYRAVKYSKENFGPIVWSRNANRTYGPYSR